MVTLEMRFLMKLQKHRLCNTFSSFNFNTIFIQSTKEFINTNLIGSLNIFNSCLKNKPKKLIILLLAKFMDLLNIRL